MRANVHVQLSPNGWNYSNDYARALAEIGSIQYDAKMICALGRCAEAANDRLRYYSIPYSCS